jgi:mRNA interferase MazF
VLLAAQQCGLPKDSKAMAQQIRTISKDRLHPGKAGELGRDLMRRIDAAIRLHLALA